jgi:2-dehydro-3-deoxyphosphogluconate aldolase/(4S)-4-hydroxy-2-oxoglutarate aldolase
MNEIVDRIAAVGVLPVVHIDDPDHAVPLAEALLRGGIDVAEVTFRSDATEAAISQIRRALPEMLLGAGTVLSPELADRAIDAGAQFAISPGLNPRVVEHCQAKGLAIMPGIATPSDIDRAMDLGLSVLKFFPAADFGGVGTLKAVAAPYSMIKFIPTGGINANNLASYLILPNVIACGGSWLVARDLVAAENFREVENLARAARTIAANISAM